MVPFYLSKLCQSKLDAIRSYYFKFLTYEEKDNFGTDVIKWKKKYQEVSLPNRTKCVVSTLSECSSEIFPTLHKIFIIFLTTPVGSVPCERSFSALRRLKLWTRSSMSEERLSGLAMMLIHRETEFIPTPEEIYTRKTNWRNIL